MKSFIAGKNEAGQRFDKYLGKLLREAPKSFIYKMLRKKNITLNGRKASGSEILSSGDEIRLFFSDDTFIKFSGIAVSGNSGYRISDVGNPMTAVTGHRPGRNVVTDEKSAAFAQNIIYEDEDLIFWNKPRGILSQPDHSGKDSIVEMLTAYLLVSGKLTENDLVTFRPAPVNRLDRNTSGIVMCGVSLRGLRFLSGAVHDRTVTKKYLCVIRGHITDGRYEAYLRKTASDNKVKVSDGPIDGGKKIITVFRTIGSRDGYSTVEALLVTGRTHQIRAHLAHLGNPIVGDPKYGNPDTNREVTDRYGIRYQMLHAAEIAFSETEETFGYLSGKTFNAVIPEEFHRFM